MIDLLLFAGRVALLAFLYLFLFFAIKTGVGLAQGTRRSKQSTVLKVAITDGPPALIGTTLSINTALTIGRLAGNDIQVSDDLISASHARLTPVSDGAILEDLASTNGTYLNGMAIRTPQALRPGDRIEAGTLKMIVEAQ